MASRFSHPEDAKALGSALRQARRARGWTQEKLGQECGFERSQVSKIENGHTASPGKHVQEMCRVLGVSVDPKTAQVTASVLVTRIEALGQASPQLLAAVDAVLNALEVAAAGVPIVPSKE